MKKLILSAFLLSGLLVKGQGLHDYDSVVTAEELKKHLSVLASDEYEGRETGEKGQRMAAEYIANFFKENGIAGGMKDGSYLQYFDVLKVKPGSCGITLNNRKLQFMNEFFYTGAYQEGKVTSDDVLFLGYGIEDEGYNDFKVDVKDKVVFILDGEPKRKNGTSYVKSEGLGSKWVKDRYAKYRLLKEKGAKGVVVLVNNYKLLASQYKSYILNARIKLKKDTDDAEDRLPYMYMDANVFDELVGKTGFCEKSKEKIGRSGRTVVKKFNVPIEFTLINDAEEGKSSNVLGFIKGSEKPEEVIVISGHYDHLGIKGDKVYNGADDDGSGTVSVMNIAKAMKQAEKNGFGPKRSVLFLLVSGEEKGLLGSEYYTDNPVYPLEKTVCDLNIDMVGRVDKKHENNADYIYLIGSDKLSSRLHELSEEANNTFSKLEMDYTYNEPNDPNRFYYRSDHYNFAKNNIPVIFYFNGVHEDYHQSTDDVEKINFEKMEKVVRLIYHTAVAVDNEPNKIEVDTTSDFKN